MNKELVEDLLQRELDGTLSDTEQESLSIHLASNLKDRELQKQLRTVVAAFREVPEVDPPASLRTHVMQTIRSQAVAAPQAHSRRKLRFSGIFEIFSTRPAMSLAVGFAAGVLAVMPFTGQWASPDLVPGSQVAGTIIADRAWPSGPAVDQIEFADGSTYGSVRLEVLANRLIVSVEATSEEPIEIVTGYNMRKLWVSGLVSREPAQLTFFSREGSVKVAHSGSVKYLLAFDGGGDDILAFNLKVVQGDRLLYSGELSTGAK